LNGELSVALQTRQVEEEAVENTNEKQKAIRNVMQNI
jgi:hypothetical protein